MTQIYFSKTFTIIAIAAMIIGCIDYIAGIIAAKKRGVRFGRPEVKVPDNFTEIIDLWEKKKVPMEEILEMCQMSKTTFYRRVREYKLTHEKV